MLDQLLGNVLGRSSGRSGGIGGLGGGGGGLSPVLMSLLPVVLGMMRNRSSAGGSMGGMSGMGGMGGMGGLGAMGGGAAMGGFGGLLQQFTQKGYGDHAQSWVSTGPNQALPPEALDDVLGRDQVSQIASQAGVSPDEARDGLSQLLPDFFDHFTPDGQLPSDDQLHSRLDDYERQLQR
jgi:uncharacterized protein YidB (DUF937 family)